MDKIDYVVEVESAALKRTLGDRLGRKVRRRRREGHRYVYFVEIKQGGSAFTAASSELAYGVSVNKDNTVLLPAGSMDGICVGTTPARVSSLVQQLIDAFDEAPEQFIVGCHSIGRGAFDVEFLDGHIYNILLDCPPEDVAVSRDRHCLLVRQNGSEPTTVPWDYIRQPDSHVAEHEKTKQKIGHALRALRTQADISQAEVAKRSGLSRVTISRLETGANLPDLNTITALASAFDIGVKSLLKKFRD